MLRGGWSVDVTQHCTCSIRRMGAKTTVENGSNGGVGDESCVFTKVVMFGLPQLRLPGYRGAKDLYLGLYQVKIFRFMFHAPIHS